MSLGSDRNTCTDFGRLLHASYANSPRRYSHLLFVSHSRPETWKYGVPRNRYCRLTSAGKDKAFGDHLANGSPVNYLSSTLRLRVNTACCYFGVRCYDKRWEQCKSSNHSTEEHSALYHSLCAENIPPTNDFNALQAAFASQDDAIVVVFPNDTTAVVCHMPLCQAILISTMHYLTADMQFLLDALNACPTVQRLRLSASKIQQACTARLARISGRNVLSSLAHDMQTLCAAMILICPLLPVSDATVVSN